MGYGLGRLLGYEVMPSLFIGLILAATSVSISAQTLMEMQTLRTRVGVGLLGAAVFDDVLVVLGLSLIIALAGEAIGMAPVLGVIIRMILYLACGTALGFFILPWLTRRVDSLPISQGLIAFAVVALLLYAWAAEVLGGMAAITGAFLAGLMFSLTSLRDRIFHGVSVLAYAVFVPIFFISVGLVANFARTAGRKHVIAHRHDGRRRSKQSHRRRIWCAPGRV